VPLCFAIEWLTKGTATLSREFQRRCESKLQELQKRSDLSAREKEDERGFLFQGPVATLLFPKLNRRDLGWRQEWINAWYGKDLDVLDFLSYLGQHFGGEKQTTALLRGGGTDDGAIEEEEETKEEQVAAVLVADVLSEAIQRKVWPSDPLQSLGIASLKVSEIASTIAKRLRVPVGAISVEDLLTSEGTVEDFAANLQSSVEERADVAMQPVKAAEAPEDHDRFAAMERRMKRHVEESVRGASCFWQCRLVLYQIAAIFVPAAYITASLMLGISLVRVILAALDIRHLGLAVLLIIPLFTMSIQLASASLLVAIKWTLLGRLREGTYPLWSSTHAARLIFVKCFKWMFVLTLWYVLLLGSFEVFAGRSSRRRGSTSSFSVVSVRKSDEAARCRRSTSDHEPCPWRTPT